MKIDRRKFIKLTGIAGVSFLIQSCSPAKQIFSPTSTVQEDLPQKNVVPTQYQLTPSGSGIQGEGTLSPMAATAVQNCASGNQLVCSGHPRLILPDAVLGNLKNLIALDPVAKKYYQSIKSAADKLLSSPSVEYKLVGTTPRLLQVSRDVLNRMYTLGLVYRIEQAPQYAQRARQELIKVANFSDWHPAHFLDTAEMTHAVSIGYDWCYPALSVDDRAKIEAAIRGIGLNPAVKYYDKHTWWTAVTHNWNLVCNGGMIAGALAIADIDLAFSQKIVQSAVASAQLALATYSPDGGWPEGPGYWDYATSYAVMMMAALRSATGTDRELSQSPGFNDTGLFRLHFVGPSGQSFNFADAGETQSTENLNPELAWLAQNYKQPVMAWAEQNVAAKKNAAPLDLIWYNNQIKDPAAAGIPLNSLFKGVHVAFMRSAWNDPKATFVGFKGGDTKANHAHLDLGTFVMEGSGQRWAIDLGADSYDLPDYFGKPRFTYYRLMTQGHNTILIDDANQDIKAKAPILKMETLSDRTLAMADLTAAYPGKLKQHLRGVALLNDQSVLVMDEIEANQSVSVQWTMHTMAEISLDEQHALLTQKGGYLHAYLLSPKGAVFEMTDATAPAPQNINKGVHKLIIRLPEKVRQTQIVVWLKPSDSLKPPVTFPSWQALSNT
jgi:hypothetical protein